MEQPLRDEVRAAIDRGVAFLAVRQRVDGAWVRPNEVVQCGIPHGDGLNALCALALLHADTAAAREAARPALARLLPADGSVAPQLLQTTYGAGIALLLLDVTGGDDARIAGIATRIAHGRDPKSGAWNYRTGSAPSTGLQIPPRAPQLSGPLNLSTSQFAVLGLHAAERHDVNAGDAAWTDVLNGLLVSQQTDGSWAYQFQLIEERVTYPTATLMGLADLVLAAKHLRATEDRGRGGSRRQHVVFAVAAARRALDADGVMALWLARRGEGGVDGYSLWSLEKACVFLDTVRLDGTPWYAHAARTLVDAQRPDGSWSAVGRGAPAGVRSAVDDLSTTAFALLVLVRDMESLRDTTPGPAPADAPVTTPSAREQDPAAAGPPPPRGVPLDVASLSAWIRDHDDPRRPPWR